MLERCFLTAVGLLYLGLGLWCAWDPGSTSRTVGFELLGGSGQSEFVTVYGGLEVGLALIFWMPWWVRDTSRAALVACTLVHASLVAFRSLSFFWFSDFQSMTYQLAAGEWAIFLLGMGLLWRNRRPQPSHRELK
jgi:hypothetical protein